MWAQKKRKRQSPDVGLPSTLDLEHTCPVLLADAIPGLPGTLLFQRVPTHLSCHVLPVCANTGMPNAFLLQYMSSQCPFVSAGTHLLLSSHANLSPSCALWHAPACPGPPSALRAQ